jgi:hypothetical protein
MCLTPKRDNDEKDHLCGHNITAFDNCSFCSKSGGGACGETYCSCRIGF